MARLIAAELVQAQAGAPVAGNALPSETTPADIQPPTVSKEEAAVLRVMLANHPVRMTAEDLAALLRPDEKSIRGYLQSLQGRGLVTEPSGKTGRALTAAGVAVHGMGPEYWKL